MRRKHLFRSSYQDSDFCYSLFSGSSLYLYCDYLEHEVFPTFIDKNKYCPEIITPDGDYYYWIKRIRYIDDKLTDKDLGVHRHYLYLIKNKPASDRILWPADMVSVSSEILNLPHRAMTVVRHHEVRDDANQRDVSNLALVFPYEDKHRSFKHTAQDIVNYYMHVGEFEQYENGVTYNNPVIRRLMVEIVKAIKSVYDSGYVYYDLSLSRFSVENNGTQQGIFLDFTNLIFGIEELYRADDYSELMIEEPKEIELDYADPFFIGNDNLIPDEQSFLFSICSLMFYLMFGRNAYKRSDQNDATPLQHYRNAMERLKEPCFVFDLDADKKDRTQLGLLEADQIVIELWERAHPKLKEMFQRTLSYENALRLSSDIYAPSLDDWLEIFEIDGWISESHNSELTIPENQ